MYYFKKTLKLKALSLAEVLVVMAISATTLVAAAQLTVQLSVTIKNNEIADFNNGIMLQALEIAKSPVRVRVASAVQISNFTGSYRIILDTPQPTLWRESQNTQQIRTCEPGSPYVIQVSAEGLVPGQSTANVCLQIIVEAETGILRQEYYQIESRAVYQTSRGTIINSALGYRREAFTER